MWTAPTFPVVRVAADALAKDIGSVTGASPGVVQTIAPVAGENAVFLGTLGKSRLIDDLVARKKLDVTRIRGKWETFQIVSVENPVPGVAQALIIVGSDRRGAAFGAFSLSESIGVSPWVWWADVKPKHRDSLVLTRTNFASKVPSVKYRGITRATMRCASRSVLPYIAPRLRGLNLSGFDLGLSELFGCPCHTERGESPSPDPDVRQTQALSEVAQCRRNTPIRIRN